MKLFEIKSRFTEDILFSLKTTSLKLAVEAAVKSGASLSGADLYKAYLYKAYLSGANLSGADLSGANIKFSSFPTIRLLSSINLGSLSVALSLELMRRDAYAHPYPKRFDEWSKGGKCPYQKEDRFWMFDLRKEDWTPGNPELTDVELIRAICAEKNWEIER